MRASIVPVTLAGLGLAGPLFAQTPSSTLKQQVFAAESSFAASMAERNFDAFGSHLSPEAIFFGDTTVMRGKQAVLKSWRRFFDKPDPPFSWKPDVIEVLPSGKLALSSGPVFNPKGQQVGTFSSIWRREPDGSWKIIFDKGCR
ncbi:MAG TPA: nuclear transport factor 2 family protein [Gemmatimonadales bacterium]|jgi:ketosteroid isomerase-like protein|nr:nuclear transport factor 2 family protein [Gemmatimonadales bacterium]